MTLLEMLKQERNTHSLQNYHNLSKLQFDVDFFQQANIDDNVFLPTYGKDLQRDYVWTLEQKQLLVKSLLISNPVPPVTVICKIGNDNGVKPYYDNGRLYQVIDGKQRINALKQFFNNEYSITVNGIEVYYKDCKVFFNMHLFLQANVFNEYENDPYAKPFSDDDKLAMAKTCSFSGTPQEVGFLDSFTKP